jgi:hypothetical protein
MKHKHLTTFIENLVVDETEIHHTKGMEYASEDDALANFKSAAKQLGLSPLQVCTVYLHKHYTAIMHHARGGDTLSESIGSRVRDLRLYAAIYLALCEDD